MPSGGVRTCLDPQGTLERLFVLRGEVLLGLPEGRNCLRCAPANSPCKPSSGSSKTGRNTRFHGPLAAKPGHTSTAPRRKGVGNSSNGRLRLTDVSAWVSTPRTVRIRPLPSSGMRPRMAISTCGQALIWVVADIYGCFLFREEVSSHAAAAQASSAPISAGLFLPATPPLRATATATARGNSCASRPARKPTFLRGEGTGTFVTH